MQIGEKRKLAEIQSGNVHEVVVRYALNGLDLSVFGLDDDRQLRDDRFFVFFNQLSSPADAVQLTLTPGEARFRLDLDRLPAEISRLIFTATHDDQPVAAATALTWTLAGEQFDPRAGLRQERAVMIAELYRLKGEWRVNAVGQGFDGGLKALLEYFGGEAEEETPATAAVPSPSPVAPIAPEPAPVSLTLPQTAPTGPVSLKKAQSVDLNKAAGTVLSRVTLGLGWDPAQRGASIDLDAGCLVFDDRKKHIDSVWFVHLSGMYGHVVHSGDNLTGEGGGDDEQIRVNLAALPPQAHWLVLCINSFSGQNFSTVQNAFCRLVDDVTGKEIARYDLGSAGKATAMLMVKLERAGGGWVMTALGEPAKGMTVRAMVRPALALL